ncbi:MAG: DUF4012 domain-containing protein [Candidatus Nanopelagicales bacterium]
MTPSRTHLVLGGALVVVVGGFVLWLQAGLLYSVANLALGGYGLQSHLSGAASNVLGGDFDTARAEYESAADSANLLARSSGVAQLDVIGHVPLASTAVENWRLASSASLDVTASTGGLLSLYGDLSGKGGGPKIFSDGAVDLAQLTDLPDRVTDAADHLRSASDAISGMATGGGTASLLRRVQEKALSEMEPVQQAMEALETIAPVLPDALGANGVRRYLVAIDNQAEMRASGGAPLSLVLVEFDDGRISIPIKGQTSTQLFPPLNAPVSWWGPSGNPFFEGNPRNAPFVVTNTHPNLLFSAKEMAGAWQGGDYPAVDGIITLDLTAIGAVLDATGPLQSDTYGTVDGPRLGQILLIDAYQQFGQENAEERQAANQKLIDDLLQRILSGDDLITVAKAMLTTAPGRHVQFWMRSPELEQIARESGTAGEVNDPGTGDWSALYTQNGNQSKVDVFQQRNVLVTVQLAEDGSARVTQQMTVTNATPADRPEGPPERIGYETSWVKNAYVMYVPDAATDYAAAYPTDFAVRPFRGHPQLGRGWVLDGFGHKMIRVVGWTKPGGQNSVSVSYRLPAGTFTQPDGSLRYRLQAEPQSLFIAPTMTVQVAAPSGWRATTASGTAATSAETAGSSATVTAVQNQPIDVDVEFTR